MISPLPDTAVAWVDRQLASMSRDEKIAHLLIPTVHGYTDAERLLTLMEDIPLGGVFVSGAPGDTHREWLDRFQGASRIPMIVAADLEGGAGYVVEGAVTFPDPLAVGAANDPDLAYTMGEAAAREGRAVGIHWTYAPVVDVNRNPDNPIANTRSLGDDPDRISRLAVAFMKGMQDHGLAACAKHFPGDGIDDLDQHVVTTINSLSLEDWKSISGRTFASVFDAGLWSIMIGHIALPCWDAHRDRRGCYRPATLSRRIITDLLRKEMGFDGLIVTDDMNMGGVGGYADRRTRTIEAIKAGCDMYLFPHLPKDFGYLKEAADSGELPEERIEDACRRVLELKARIGLHETIEPPPPPQPERIDVYRAASRTMAEKALVQVRDLNRTLPLKNLKPGARVLTMTLSSDRADMPLIDDLLKERGFEVDHIVNLDDFRFFETAPDYDAIFVNFLFRAAWAYSSVRCVGAQNRIMIGGFYSDRPNVVFTSFGSPYHLRMFSALPNLLNVHTASETGIRAAVRAWFGELEANGQSPVQNLERPPVVFG